MKTLILHPGHSLSLKQVVHGSHSDWKTWKNGRAFSSQGKVREFYPKCQKNQKKIDWKMEKKKYWKSQGNLPASNSESPADMTPYFKYKKNFKKTGKL